ncbi:MAG: hypothetical protein OXS29_09890 [bacterium]|nr:hypothetical protein [bacterium]
MVIALSLLLITASPSCPNEHIEELTAAVAAAEAQLDAAADEYASAEAHYWQLLVDQVASQQLIARHIDHGAFGLASLWWSAWEQYYAAPSDRAWLTIIPPAQEQLDQAGRELARARRQQPARCQYEAAGLPWDPDAGQCRTDNARWLCENRGGVWWENQLRCVPRG